MMMIDSLESVLRQLKKIVGYFPFPACKTQNGTYTILVTHQWGHKKNLGPIPS